MYLSPEYQRWIKVADGSWLEQKPRGRFVTIEGPFAVEVVIAPKRPQQRLDGDNHFKAALDWAQRVEIIRDDAYCMDHRIRRGTTKEAPTGYRLVIKELDSQS